MTRQYQITIVSLLVWIVTAVPGCATDRSRYLSTEPLSNTELTLQQPVGAVLHPLGGLLVADSGNHRLVWMRRDGRIRDSFGTRGSAPGQFMRPLGVDTDTQGRIYVADYLNDRIQVLDKDGQPIAMWSTFGRLGKLNGPADISVSHDGYVYVVEFNGSRVMKLTLSGQPVTAWGAQGHGDGQLYYPTRINIDRHGSIWVTDTYNHRLVVYNPDGRLRMIYGGKGTSLGQFNVPGGIAFDLDNNPWVADFSNHRIQQLVLTGQELRAVKAWDVQFNNPIDIQIDTHSDTIYIVDYRDNQVVRTRSFPARQSLIQPTR